jgi:hypothetical protein
MVAVLSSNVALSLDQHPVFSRCVEVLTSHSGPFNSEFRLVLEALSPSDQELVGSYFGMLTADVSNRTSHIQELPQKQKGELWAHLFDTANPSLLIEAFLAHNKLADALTKGRSALSPSGATELEGLATRLRAYLEAPALPTGGPTSQVGSSEAIVSVDLSDPELSPASQAGDQTSRASSLEVAVAPVEPVTVALAMRSIALQPKPSAVAGAGSAQPGPTRDAQDTASLDRIQNADSAAAFVGALFDSASAGSIEHRMLMVLIGRLWRFLEVGNHQAVGGLGVFIEKPEIFRSGATLATAFREAELGLSVYRDSQLLVGFLEAWAKKASAGDRAAILAELEREKQKLNQARAKIGKWITVYLKIKTFLEETVRNPECEMGCRTGALQVLAGLGKFELAVVATETRENVFSGEIRSLLAGAVVGDAPLRAAYKLLGVELAKRPVFDSATTFALVSKDPELLRLKAEATEQRARWGGVQLVFNSNIFTATAAYIQGFLKLDNIPVLNLIPRVAELARKAGEPIAKWNMAENARDRREQIYSVGPLLVLTQLRLPIEVKMAELAHTATYHPDILVTMYRHHIFRPLVQQIKQAAEKNETLKFNFQLLLDGLAKGATHPDASRPLNIVYEPSKLELMATAAINTGTIGLGLFAAVHYALASAGIVEAWSLPSSSSIPGWFDWFGEASKGIAPEATKP